MMSFYKTIAWPQSPQITYLFLDQSQTFQTALILSYCFAAMKLGEDDFTLNPSGNSPKAKYTRTEQ